MNALQWHTVKTGETLATIARKLRVNRTDLAEANYLQRPLARHARAASWSIPRMPSAALLRARRRRPTTARAASVAVADGRDVDGTGRGTVYRVRAGDTLFAIAQPPRRDGRLS